MEDSERPGLVVAQIVIAHLQQSVQAWTDADRVLPEDSLSLLATLDRARGGLVQGNPLAARAGFDAFAGRVQGLIADGVLAAEDGCPRIEAAAAMGALLPGADAVAVIPPHRGAGALGHRHLPQARTEAGEQ